MTDRVPTYPGRYTASLTAEALQAMQAGEDFDITLVRNDVPITTGTPYSKASVLPDSVAESLCPSISDPTPADALAAIAAALAKVPAASDVMKLSVYDPKSTGSVLKADTAANATTATTATKASDADKINGKALKLTWTASTATLAITW